jgi:hypothetical protein
MPIRFRYDAEQRILFTTAEGVLTLAEILEHLARESTEKAVAYREVFDATHARLETTISEVKMLVSQLHARMRDGPFGPTAVIAANDYFFGMASMVAILAELRGGPQIAVFRNLSDALEWLLRT